MPTSRASARASATCLRSWSPPPAASSDTLLGPEKQWSNACTRSLTRLPRCCHALSNPSPYSSRGSRPSTFRQRRSTVSTFTRLVPPARHAARHARPALAAPHPRPGAPLGAWVGPPQRCTADLAGGWVEALEHRPHLLRARHAFEAAGLGGAGDEDAA